MGSRLGPQDSTIEGAVNFQKEEPYGTSLDPWGDSHEGDYGTLANSLLSLLLGVVMSNLFQQTLPAGAISVSTKAPGNESTQSWTGAFKTEGPNQTKTQTTFFPLYANFPSSPIVVMER